MATTVGSTPLGGPAIRGNDPWLPSNPSAGKLHQMLSDDERSKLATIASIVRFKKGERIYSNGDSADAVFNIISGVVKASTFTSDNSEHITAFLYPEDLFGLAENGHYTNVTTALAPTTAYRLPVSALRRQLSKDADLEFHMIVKLCHELRQTQHHALLIAQKHALSRLAMFLQLQEYLQSFGDKPQAEIYLPMDRSDIADYVSMSLAAVSRGFRTLAERGVLKSRDRRHVKILDRKAFEELGNVG